MLGVLETLRHRPRMKPARGGGALFAEAGRLAFADRNLYLGDPDFVSVPVAGLIDPAYLDEPRRADQPGPQHGRRQAGRAARAQDRFCSARSDGIEHGTSHISIVDADGTPCR